MISIFLPLLGWCFLICFCHIFNTCANYVIVHFVALFNVLQPTHNYVLHTYHTSVILGRTLHCVISSNGWKMHWWISFGCEQKQNWFLAWIYKNQSLQAWPDFLAKVCFLDWKLHSLSRWRNSSGKAFVVCVFASAALLDDQEHLFS